MRILRAETRQSAEALLFVGEAPRYRLPLELRSPGEVGRYFSSLDWEQPWAAASHVSHQLVFASLNQRLFSGNQHGEPVVDEILSRFDALRDPLTGGWFAGQTAPDIVVNGAMKVFSGLQWLNRSYPDCTQLCDFALSRPFVVDGCGFLNRLFVLYHCRKGTPEKYRQPEIFEVAEKALEIALRFRKSDGGFSFYQERAQSVYYGAKVSRSLPESDLHGTVMVTWALGLIAEMMGLSSSDIGMFRPQGPPEFKSGPRNQADQALPCRK